jgi:hypothetical protein
MNRHRIEIIPNLRSIPLDPGHPSRQPRQPSILRPVAAGHGSAMAAMALDFLVSPSRCDRKLCTGEIRIGEVRNFPCRTSRVMLLFQLDLEFLYNFQLVSIFAYFLSNVDDT